MGLVEPFIPSEEIIPVVKRAFEQVPLCSILTNTYMQVDFLVACYASLHPALSVLPLVRPSHFTFFLVFAVFGLTAPALVIKWSQIRPLPTRTQLG